MRCLVEHGGETEGVAMRGGCQFDFLMIVVDGGDLHAAGEQDVSAVAVLAHLVDGLTRGEVADFDLRRENGEFVVIEKGKELNMA